MKKGIPDSVKQVILNNSNLNFNFSLEKPVLKLDSDYISRNAAIRKWLKGDYIEFVWTGDRFVVKKMGFEYEAPKD